jgi:GTPase SAR1 family protein
MYSITSRESWAEVEKYHNQIMQVKVVDRPVIIVGNKCDLHQERAVAEAEGRVWAAAAGYLFLEVSVQDRVNVDAIFSTLVREIRKVYGGETLVKGSKKCLVM